MLSAEEIKNVKISLKNIFPKGIPECGVDALRFTLLSSNIKSLFSIIFLMICIIVVFHIKTLIFVDDYFSGQYINFDVEHCNRNRLFCNKIWQACNFANEWLQKLCFTSEFMMLDNFERHQPCSLMEKWILAKLNCLVQVMNDGLKSGDFHLATTSIRNFIHLELCDIYIVNIEIFYNDIINIFDY